MFQGPPSVNDLLARPAHAVLAFVQDGREAIDCSQEWKDLAEGASTSATCDARLNASEVQAWATVAVLILERLSEKCADEPNRPDYEKAAMSLRAYMINRFGHQMGHPVLDAETIENWFFRRVDLTYDEATAMNERVNALDAYHFLKLSSLKDRIRIMRSLPMRVPFRNAEEVFKWFSLVTP